MLDRGRDAIERVWIAREAQGREARADLGEMGVSGRVAPCARAVLVELWLAYIVSSDIPLAISQHIIFLCSGQHEPRPCFLGDAARK